MGKTFFWVSAKYFFKLLKDFWCLCRVVLGFILISFKTLWFRFRLGSIGLVVCLFKVGLRFV